MQKLNSRNLPWPVDWNALFGRPGPLILEIGFGYGQFLLHLARTYPDHNLVGLEVSNRCLTAVETRIAADGVENISVIHSPAETALAHLFTPASLAQIHVNFPDPWFKSRHSHRRLMKPETLNAMVNRLQPGGYLYLATDIRDYAEMSAELLAETPGLDNLLPTPWTDDLPGRVITKYERKARREGRPCHYFAYRRNATPPPPVVTIEELPMPHIVIETPLKLDDVYAAFARHEYHTGDVHINIIDAYLGRDALALETFVKEPTIDQRVVFMLHGRANPDEYTLQLSTIGQPRPTPGIHEAARLLGEWLIGLHPSARVVKQSLQSENDA